jgi:hypothetical protein
MCTILFASFHCCCAACGTVFLLLRGFGNDGALLVLLAAPQLRLSSARFGLRRHAPSDCNEILKVSRVCVCALVCAHDFCSCCDLCRLCLCLCLRPCRCLCLRLCLCVQLHMNARCACLSLHSGHLALILCLRQFLCSIAVCCSISAREASWGFAMADRYNRAVDCLARCGVCMTCRLRFAV